MPDLVEHGIGAHERGPPATARQLQLRSFHDLHPRLLGRRSGYGRSDARPTRDAPRNRGASRTRSPPSRVSFASRKWPSLLNASLTVSEHDRRRLRPPWLRWRNGAAPRPFRFSQTREEAGGSGGARALAVRRTRPVRLAQGKELLPKRFFQSTRPGSSNRNVLPLPTALFTSMAPSWSARMCFTIERPRPVPPLVRARALSTL